MLMRIANMCGYVKLMEQKLKQSDNVGEISENVL